MIYILFVALFLLTGIAFIAGNRNILSPWTIVCAMFTVSTFFAMINAGNWGFTMDVSTVLIIISALLTFGFGQQLTVYLMERRRPAVCGSRLQSSASVQQLPKAIHIPFGWMLIVCAVLFVMLFYYFYKTYQLSLAAGNHDGLSRMLTYVRQATLNFGTIGKLGNIFSIVAQGAAYVFSFVYLYNLIWRGWNWADCIYLVPMAILLLFQVLSANRASFITDIAYLLVIGCVLYQHKKKWNYWNTVFILLIGIFALCVFLLIFRVTGLMKDSGTGVSMFSSISKYIGFSIPGFNDYVLNPRPDTGYIGDHTLLSVYSVLRQLGFDLPQLSIHHDFVNLTNISSNVYSCLRRYIEDYTYLGMYVIMGGMGAFYGGMFRYVQYHPQSNFFLVVYANLAYPLFMLSIDDQFFLYLFTTTFLYLFVIIAVLYYCFIYRFLHPKKKIAINSFTCEKRRGIKERKTV